MTSDAIIAQLVQSNVTTSEALRTIARGSRRRTTDHDRDHLAPDSDNDYDDFDWATFLATAGISPGCLSDLRDTGYLEVPRRVGKLIRRARASLPGVPYVSAQHVTWWEPPYIINNPMPNERAALQKRRRASDDPGPFLSNILTWGVAHVAAKSFALSDLFVYLLVLLRLQDEYGDGVPKRYPDRLMNNIMNRVRSNDRFDIGPLLRVRQRSSH